MRTINAIEAWRNYQLRLCEALGLDLAVTTEVTLNRAEGRVEWTRVWEGVDLNAYDWHRATSGEATVVVGLYVARDISNEAWDTAVEIEDEWLRQFPTAEVER